LIAEQCENAELTVNVKNLPGFKDLISNLSDIGLPSAVPLIGGLSQVQLIDLRVELSRRRDTGVSSTIAEIYALAVEYTDNDAFQALTLAHETLRDNAERSRSADASEREALYLVEPIRGDGPNTDEVGARYHLLGTAIYAFWTEHQRHLPVHERSEYDFFDLTPEYVVGIEEGYISGDIRRDPAELVVDLVGVQLGRDLYEAVARRGVVPFAEAIDICAGGGRVRQDPGCVTGTIDVTPSLIVGLSNVLENTISVCRDGDELSFGALMEVRAVNPGPAGGECEIIATYEYEGTGTVPDNNSAFWSSNGELRVHFEGIGDCGPPLRDVALAAGIVGQIDGQKMTGLFESQPWTIEDVSELLLD
jgi:hypothetical protein